MLVNDPSPLSHDSLGKMASFNPTKVPKIRSEQREINLFSNYIGEDLSSHNLPINELIHQTLSQFFSKEKKCDEIKQRALVAKVNAAAAGLSLVRLKEVIKEHKTDPESVLDALFDDPEFSTKDLHFRALVAREYQRLKPALVNFIPTVLDLLLGTLDILDPYRFGVKLWERSQIFEVAIKLVVVPYLLIQFLSPIVTLSLKSYAVAVVAILALGLLLKLYKEYLRPPPPRVVDSKDLDIMARLGELPKPVEFEDEIPSLESAIMQKRHVLIVADAGEGKTSLIHRFAYEKQEKDFHSEIKQKRLHEIKTSKLMGGGMMSQGELLQQIQEQVKGYEEDFIFFLDEFMQILEKEEVWRAFKGDFLTGSGKVPHFIIAMTLKEYQTFQQSPEYEAFKERFKVITIPKPTDEKVKKIIKLWLNEKCKIPILKDVEGTLFRYYQEEDKAGRHLTLRNFKGIVDDAIGPTSNWYDADKKSKKNIYDHYRKMYLIYHFYVTREGIPFVVKPETITRLERANEKEKGDSPREFGDPKLPEKKRRLSLPH